jgi:hypothetical protein
VSEPLAGAAMSQDEFDQNWSVIASDVASILAAEAKSRRRFRLIAVHEKVSGHLLAEVFQTTRGPVVVTNDAEHNSRERIRRGARRDLTTFTGEPEQVFLIRGVADLPCHRRPLHHPRISHRRTRFQVRHAVRNHPLARRRLHELADGSHSSTLGA